MNLMLVILALLIIRSSTPLYGNNTDCLSIHQTRSINGIATILIFLSHATQYLTWGGYRMRFFCHLECDCTVGGWTVYGILRLGFHVMPFGGKKKISRVIFKKKSWKNMDYVCGCSDTVYNDKLSAW